MKQAELIAYIVQIRAKLSDGTYTPDDAYIMVWNSENNLNFDQRREVHLALELPFELPEPLDFLVPENIRGE